MKRKIFIDGSSGTTGLRIRERLAIREDISLMILPEEKRRDPAARKAAIREADIAFLCLPDDAATEAAGFAEGSDTVIIDTSTAHRTSPGWTYGFPELSPAIGEALKTSKRIAVPGCHAGGFIALVRPLTDAGIIDPSALISCFSLTGYSGGGKKMIAEYESPERDALLSAPRQYALGQSHKHLKEMRFYSGLDSAPVFCPVVGDFYSGMEVTVPLFSGMLNGAGPEDIKRIYRERYRGPVVSYSERFCETGFLSAASLSGRDSMEISVSGNGDRIILCAVYDNLGKGASGAAIECMNTVMGADPALGLDL